MDHLSIFIRRVLEEWLPTYCADPRKNYDPSGFKESSIVVDPVDARDCMRAIDGGVVRDRGHGRYTALRGTATEPLFWEGARDKCPRPITLWLEPVITFAALARLHFDFGWPVELLGNQSRNWAFDLAAHCEVDPDRYCVLGEVKKSIAEVDRLTKDLLALCAEPNARGVLENSRKKWAELVRARPELVWIVGPAMHQRVFRVAADPDGSITLKEEFAGSLTFAAEATQHVATVLAIAGEGGGYRIMGRRGRDGTWQLRVHTSDWTPTLLDEDPIEHDGVWVNTLPEALAQINQSWFRLHPREIHPAFRNAVLAEVAGRMLVLREQGHMDRSAKRIWAQWQASCGASTDLLDEA